MKKRLATIALVLCVMACCLWACASQPSGNGGAGGDAAQDQKPGEASDQASDQDQADAIKLLSGKEKVAAAQEFYAPKVTTAQNGAEVQLIPNDPYMWNTAILDGENRGCTASQCHESILDATQLLPMSHPKLWNPYGIDPTIKFCYMCHSKALFLQDSMHALHMNSAEFAEKGGNCDSCHYINPNTGAYEMWDLVKYDTAYMGITPVAEAKGDFSFTQDSITDTDEVFYYWENSDHQGVILINHIALIQSPGQNEISHPDTHLPSGIGEFPVDPLERLIPGNFHIFYPFSGNIQRLQSSLYRFTNHNSYSLPLSDQHQQSGNPGSNHTFKNLQVRHEFSQLFMADILHKGGTPENRPQIPDGGPAPVGRHAQRRAAGDALNGSEHQGIHRHKSGKPGEGNGAQLLKLHKGHKQIGKSEQQPRPRRVIISLHQIHRVDEDGQPAGENIHHRGGFSVHFI